MGSRKVFAAVVGALLCLGLGIASGLASAGGPGDWYASLVAPPGNPPSWVFGPMWSILYILMGIAMGLLAYRRAWGALGLFLTQFLLNLAWTPVFFGAHQIGLALVIIVSMLLVLLRTIVVIRKGGGSEYRLLIPYAMWLCYATWLNAGYFYLNRS